MTGTSLLDRVRYAIRVRQYSVSTEKTYVAWVRRFILFHGKRHPLEMEKPEVEAFLTHLAVNRTVSPTSSSKSKGVEYGVHVPLIAYGAGIKKRGMTDELADFTDILPTLVEFAGTTVPEKYHVDGTSLAPFLTGKSEQTKDVIFSFPAVATLVRTKEFLLEAVAPIYGKPRGRFYKTNGSHDGRGYENITHDPAYADARALFDRYLEAHPNPLPTRWDDPAWARDAAMERAKKFWADPKREEKHLTLPREYQFYDESF